MLNKYLDQLELLVREYREAELTQFEGPDGKKAGFDDLIWYHIEPNTGRRIRYLCGVHGRKGRGNIGSQSTNYLAYPYNQLVKIWTITTVNTALSAVEKKARVGIVRKLLSLMKGDLYTQSETTISSLNLGARSADRLRPFLIFCADNGIMRKVELKSQDRRDRSGHAHFDNASEKLPNINAILSLANIFSTVFEHVDEKGFLASGAEINMRDALVVTFAALSLASPNRAAAEIPVLPKQRLHLYSEGAGEPVYYLDWIGSKGYRNYKNHILAALARPIQKAIDFFYEACEPARILCRFYENPNKRFVALLGGFEMALDIKKNVNMNLAPNLFTLGYALGFYSAEACVPVVKDGADLASISRPQKSRFFFEEKPIYLLRLDDRLSASCFRDAKSSALPYLFGYEYLPKVITDKATISVREVQEWWISYYKKNIVPEFPISFTNAESSIRLKDAMFCFLGSWFYGAREYRGSSGKPFQKSNYAVVPLASLGASFINSLAGQGRCVKSIFQRYGFSSHLKLLPHSLRHFSNTLADLSEIPVEIIAAWSGRSSSEQTRTYIHTSQDDLADRVSAIMNSPDVDRRNIRVVSQEKLSYSTNLPASVTSTGVCTQNLNVTPCNYLNDFVAQCFLCPESCHVAGDQPALTLLEKDHSFQSARLSSVAVDVRLPTSQAMKHWYVIHSRNTHILTMLIDLMKTSSAGTLIRYSNTTSEFILTNIKTMAITKVALVLPVFEERLKRIIEAQGVKPISALNPQLYSLLSSFGLDGKV
ncbi:hypothetical protein ACGFZ7_02100 [Pseudomonas sp. NPDC047963]|nr:hypothetical protein [Pseudomonas sp.]